MAGAGGGVAGIIAGQPLDVVRVRLQQKSPHKGSLSSMWRQIVRKEGMRSLFKGAAYPVTTIAMQVRAVATATLLLTDLESLHPSHVAQGHLVNGFKLLMLDLWHMQHAIVITIFEHLIHKLQHVVQLRACNMPMQNAVVFYSYGTACQWLASRDASRSNAKAPLKLWQVYVAGSFRLCPPIGPTPASS